MALFTSPILSSAPTIQIKQFQNRPYQLTRYSFPSHSAVVGRSAKAWSVGFGTCGGDDYKLQWSMLKERMQEFTPIALKEFPWKKAENVVLNRMCSIGIEGLKWSSITVYVFTFVSNVVLAVSAGKELMIPLGLFVGYLITNFVVEVLKELLQISEEKASLFSLLAFGSLSTLLKTLSPPSLAIRSLTVLLLFVRNGCLMQSLWLCRHFFKVNDESSKDTESTSQSTA